jgi:hypothetical protein
MIQDAKKKYNASPLTKGRIAMPQNETTSRMPKMVFDRFHLVKLNNQNLGMLRRQLMGIKTYAERQVIKGYGHSS